MILTSSGVLSVTLVSVDTAKEATNFLGRHNSPAGSALLVIIPAKFAGTTLGCWVTFQTNISGDIAEFLGQKIIDALDAGEESRPLSTWSPSYIEDATLTLCYESFSHPERIREVLKNLVTSWGFRFNASSHA